MVPASTGGLPLDLAFTVEGLLSAEECAALVTRAERIGFEAAPVTTAVGMVMRPDIRNNTRVMADDFETTGVLWERLRGVAPKQVGWEACGLNERIRYYRYEPGESFAPHRDGYFARSTSERSFFTLLVYLNEGCLGGETTILTSPREEDAIRVVPQRGMGLVFAHRLLHEGSLLRHGIKYVLRSDIMYRKQSV